MSNSANQQALLDAVRAFHADDPDDVTRAELQALLDKNDVAGLQARFAVPLTFGTAGLRGEIGAGPARMNRAVVARATAGLCMHVLEANPKAKEQGLAIGFDGRRMSRELAEETAAVAAGFGIPVHVFDDPVPTPVLAFAVLDVGAAAGVMVTASHNPAADNGYKAYWDNGAQVIPPHDRGTEDAMAKVTSVKALKRLDKEAREQAGLQRAIGDDVTKRYLAGVAEIGDFGSRGGRALPIVYTPLHGVGGRWVKAALGHAGFNNLHVVAEQYDPHPDFPTVAFPNPEEPGAMDLAHALAKKVNAVLVLANDPDADRLAVAARDKNGELVAFTGNEVGALLSEHLLTRAGESPNNLILSSIVSSPIVGVIAKAHGARWEPTLTGFKWIANRAIELRKQKIEMVLGLEEALGYSAGALVRDKDGVSSALCIASIAAELHEKGQSLVDALDAVFAKYGAFVSGQVSLKAAGLDGPAKMAAVMARAREPAGVGRGLRGQRDHRSQGRLVQRHAELRSEDAAVERRGDLGARRARPDLPAPERHRAEAQAVLRRREPRAARRAGRRRARPRAQADERAVGRRARSARSLTICATDRWALGLRAPTERAPRRGPTQRIGLMQRKGLLTSSLSVLLLVACCGCGDDEDKADGGGAPEMDGSTDEGPKDAGRDAYVWNPMGGMGGSGGGGSGGGSGIGGSGGSGGSGLDGRMCAEPRDYLPEAFLPRCSADTAACIAGCATEADADACRDACIEADTTPAETQFGLNCGACIYLTLFACIDMTECHDGVAEVFCCIEDNCPTGSAEGCADQMCGGDIEAAVVCGYNANQDCVDFAGDVLGRCFAAGDEDAGL